MNKKTYNVEVIAQENEKEVVLKVSFGEPAGNDQIVKDAEEAVKVVAQEVAGKLVKINGPASLPVAFVLAHTLNHVCPAVGVFDPKLGKYVIAVSHTPDLRIGDLI